MLSTLPLDEVVQLNVIYQIDTSTGTTRTKSPLSRQMSLRQAIGQAVGLIGSGAKVSIVARGVTYRDTSEFLAIWSRRDFHQKPQ